VGAIDLATADVLATEIEVSDRAAASFLPRRVA
jgi:hypothetical protein